MCVYMFVYVGVRVYMYVSGELWLVGESILNRIFKVKRYREMER